MLLFWMKGILIVVAVIPLLLRASQQYYGADSCGCRALGLGRGDAGRDGQYTDGLDGFFAARARFSALSRACPRALQHARRFAPQGWEQPRQH